MRDLTARRVTLAVAAVLTTAIGAGAEPAPAGTAKRAFALADFYRLRPVLEPVISPDGRTIVYTVTSRDLEHAKQTVHLWRVDADGTHARALTAGDTTNQQPTFSPDGGRLAFLSISGMWRGRGLQQEEGRRTAIGRAEGAPRGHAPLPPLDAVGRGEADASPPVRSRGGEGRAFGRP